MSEASISVPVPSEAPNKRVLPWLVAVAFFMESLDTTILNTALPAMAKALDVAPLSMKAVLTSYTLSLAVFIPVSGWAADRFGTRRVFFGAIAVFALGSLLCGVVNDLHLLVACRILQGAGGALMVPVGRLVMVRTFAKSELLAAMTFVAIPALIGPMLGPLVGGLIVGFVHWRMLFFVNLPIAMVGLYFVRRYLPDYRAERATRLDWTGFTLFGSGLALLSYVLEVFGEHTLSAREIVSLFALSIVLMVAYVRYASGKRHPLLRLRLLGIRTLRIAVSGSFVTRLGVGGMPFLLPLLYQVGLGYTPVQSGLLLLPQSLSALAFRAFTPKLLTRFGYRRVLLTNTLALGAVIALFATVGARTPILVIVLEAIAFGFFSSFQYTSMNTLAYADVGADDTSMASTIASTTQQMSMSFGVAAASLATAIFVPDRFHSSALQMIHGIHEAFLVLGAFTLLSALIFRGLERSDGDNVSHHQTAALE